MCVQLFLLIMDTRGHSGHGMKPRERSGYIIGLPILNIQSHFRNPWTSLIASLNGSREESESCAPVPSDQKGLRPESQTEWIARNRRATEPKVPVPSAEPSVSRVWIRSASEASLVRTCMKIFSHLKNWNIYGIIVLIGIIVQLVRAPPCHGGSCGFESRWSRSVKLAFFDWRLHTTINYTATSKTTSCIRISELQRPSFFF